jgi:hypothetical protein
MKNRNRSTVQSAVMAVLLVFAIAGAPVVSGAGTPLLDRLTSLSQVISTVPTNGDVNPYGIVVVPTSVGTLTAGNILISNFNNFNNLQGTGTTIVQITPDGSSVTTFAQIDASTLPGSCPGGVGLTTALAVLRTGWVIVGSLPTSDGTSATMQAGCLIVLDKNGNVAETISGPLINGPWDMTSFEFGDQVALFVTNVLNGTVAANGSVVNNGTVVRIYLRESPTHAPIVEAETVIGSGFSQRTDPNALVIGATGVGLSAPCNIFDKADCVKGADFPLERVLYVADTLNNRIAAIPDPFIRLTSAGTGITVSEGGALNQPLGLIVAPNNHIITANAADGNGVETTARGLQVATSPLDLSGDGAGTLFGLVFDAANGKLFYVDDGNNFLDVAQQ